MPMAPMTTRTTISSSPAKGRQSVSPLARTLGCGTPGTQEISGIGDVKRGAGIQEEGVGISPVIAGGDAISRFKHLMTGKISLRNYNGQVGEVMKRIVNR